MGIFGFNCQVGHLSKNKIDKLDRSSYNFDDNELLC